MAKSSSLLSVSGLFKLPKMDLFFWFGGILGSASGAEFPVSLSNHIGFTPRLLYNSTPHSPESYTCLKTAWAQYVWLQWSFENWYFHLDISRWLNNDLLDHFLALFSRSTRRTRLSCWGWAWSNWANYFELKIPSEIPNGVRMHKMKINYI